MLVKPFRGLRPEQALAARIPSPPYDVLSSAEARTLAADDPYSFLHVIKPEIDLDPSISPYDDSVYETGRKNLARMIDRGQLVRDPRPAFYVYRLVMGDHAQTGVLGAAAVQDYLDDRVKRHEHTRPEKEDDRVRLNAALGVNPGPVFLTYRPLPEMNANVTGATAGEPTVHFRSPDGVEHTLWVVDDPSVTGRIETLFGKVRCSYVADGHHRAAAAAKVGTRRIATIESPTGAEPANYFLAAHFPSDQLRILDYNRVVTDLNGLDPPTLIERIEAAGFHVKQKPRPRRPPHRQTLSMYVEGTWYLLTARAEIVPDADVVRRLDVALLSDHILRPILGLGDPRTDRRIDFVGGIRGMDELERRVDSGQDAVAFALYPTALEEVMAVADAGEVMPPKSTWFEPKLRSGMVIQSLDGDRL
jgi:uncharacterized protein (DUF1015 family)